LQGTRYHCVLWNSQWVTETEANAQSVSQELTGRDAWVTVYKGPVSHCRTSGVLVKVHQQEEGRLGAGSVQEVSKMTQRTQLGPS
jgi:hypothetical protein